MAKITLVGCKAFFENAGSDLFEKLILPEGLNKETLVNNIIYHGGDFEVLYANPYYIKESIGTWSAVHLDTFNRWVNALALEYNPLENYDRKEDWTDQTTRDSEGTSTSASGSTTGTNTSDENTKSAFDSSTYQPNEKNEAESSTTASSNDSTTVNNSEDGTFTHGGRIHGNIGVTTSQQMLISELDLGYWNVYQRITELFLHDFVIPVY